MVLRMLRDFTAQGPTQFPDFELTPFMNLLSPIMLIS